MTDIIKAIECCNYNYIGIRHLADDEHYETGDYCRNSYDWDYTNDCSTYETSQPVELSGVCAYDTHIVPMWDDLEEIAEKLATALSASNVYYGDTVIVAGDRIEYGNDLNEIIIADAIVIASVAPIAIQAA